jgi:type IV pilus assembly protein PilY1
MKAIRTFWIGLLLCLSFAAPSYAYDTDLYMASGEGVESNILVIFDNSGSMDEEVQAYFYDPAITYDPLVVPQADRNKVYYKKSGSGWGLFASSIGDVACPAARTVLTNLGHYEGDTNASCTKTERTLRTGNYRNYLVSIGGEETLPKLTIAKRVITEFINTVHGVRAGIMIFNNSQGGRILTSIRSLTDVTRPQLIDDIDSIDAETNTPLAETLYEAGRYFKGGSSYFNNGVVYTSPIEYQCQKNYVIYITDGEPTQDRDPILASAIGDRDGDGREPGGAHEVHYSSYGTDYLDDVAKYLYETDLRTDLTGTQNIITYTIGFAINSNLLERTATHGHGTYFYANNAQSLANAFQNIVDDILSKSSSFVAPIVPVSRMEKTTAGDKMYLALFKPLQDKMWSGNIKKFSVAQADNPGAGIKIGDVLDATGAKALDSGGQFYATARSHWTASGMDGGEVQKGGVGEVLQNRTSARNLYTYLGSNVNLTHSSNVFSLANGSITPTLLGLPAGDTTARDKLVKFVQGEDAYDDNGNGDTSEKRDWILGSFLHSRPLVVHYATRSVIFAGSNDGMFHAFDDSDGSELWGFIPPNLLNALQSLHADVLQSFVDGSPKAYISYNEDGSISRVILIFGERRGGNHYYALDVTNPVSPQYLWRVAPDVSGYSELGQTWSTPTIGEIAYGAGTKWVAFIGGGYDTNQDNDPVVAADSKGRAVYVVDVLTGAKVWGYSFAQNAQMTYSIPSDVARLDVTRDGKIDRLYVGDMGGRVWRFDIGGADPANWTGRIIFQSNSALGDKRKIFYPPDVSLEKEETVYEMVYFSTGDREHPKEATVVDRLYAFKDKNSGTILTENDLVDVTADQLQNGTEAEKTTTRAQLAVKKGWYIRLENQGEKSLAPPIVFMGKAYYTTFAPNAAAIEGDPCYVGEGVGRVYILNYLNGNAAFDLDLLNNTERVIIAKSDRVKLIGTAIPSGVIITVIADTVVAYAGVGGGVYMPTISTKKSIVPLSWRALF